jgi:hypothetical protein
MDSEDIGDDIRSWTEDVRSFQPQQRKLIGKWKVKNIFELKILCELKVFEGVQD